MDHDRFAQLVEESLRQLPKKFRRRLTNVAIMVEDYPSRSQERGLLLGLFHGVPLTEKSTFYAGLPDRIVIYQKNIETLCQDEQEIRRQIRDTLLHELGHYFGMREEELSDV